MRKTNIILLLISTIFILKCVEPISIENRSFEKFLVVEALLTNEFKKHTIKLSNTFALNENNIIPETGATVTIIDNGQNIYNFNEISEGTYESIGPFEAALNGAYTLKITTSDGESYSSTPEQIEGINTINDVQLELKTDNGLGVGVGVGVIAISQESNNDAQYYRFTFEETYKIVAPKWSEFTAVPTSRESPFQIDLITKTVNDRVCFNTENSNEIILFDTSGLAENRVDTEVNFLSVDNYKIAHRYSILVRQYVQTFEAHNYYDDLKKLSLNESVFTQNQPGFLQGNITSDTNPNNKVVGFFEVASYSEKRIFFNFLDFFKGIERPFITDCNAIFFELTAFDDVGRLFSPAIRALDAGLIYFEGSYQLISPICGDCRQAGGSLTRPDFWID